MLSRFRCCVTMTSCRVWGPTVVLSGGIAVRNTYRIDEIVEILKSGRFDPLRGLAEDVQIEAKGEPYQLLGSDRQKQELAKDVSALANSCGGIVLIGFRTTKSSLTSVEEIECCRPFEASLFAAEQYRNVLQDWIHPSIHSVQIDYYASLSEPGKGVAAIVVPPEAPTNKPYVLTRVVGQEGRLHGTLIGYFERVLDRIPPTSVGTLRSYIKDGMRFGEFSERLTAIETTLAKLLPAASLATDQPFGNQTNKETNPAEQLTQRTVKAESAVERTGQPNFVLAAAPMSQSNLPQLFESHAAPVVRLLEHPPVLREEGFVIRVPKQSSIIKGDLRRCAIEGYKIIDLWNDGTLVAVGPGDYDFLCWARQPRENVGLPIRNFVLAETTFNFVQLASEVFKQAEPPPTRLKFFLSLKNMTLNGMPCALSSERDNIRFPRAGETKTVPDSTITSEFEVPFGEMDVGHVVYELLARIYAFFGFNHNDMPYVNNDDPKRVTPKSMFISLDSTL
jgi:hypothetical protein